METVIHRTSILRNNIKNQIAIYSKFVFGKRVKIGKRYSGYQTINGINVSDGKCTPLYYDKILQKLLIQVSDKTNSIVFLEGDIVVWKNVIVSGGGGSIITFSNEPQKAIDEIIRQYTTDKNISEEIVFSALRKKYYKYPPSYLQSIARMYLTCWQ